MSMTHQPPAGGQALSFIGNVVGIKKSLSTSGSDQAQSGSTPPMASQAPPASLPATPPQMQSVYPGQQQQLPQQLQNGGLQQGALQASHTQQQQQNYFPPSSALIIQTSYSQPSRMMGSQQPLMTHQQQGSAGVMGTQRQQQQSSFSQLSQQERMYGGQHIIWNGIMEVIEMDKNQMRQIQCSVYTSQSDIPALYPDTWPRKMSVEILFPGSMLMAIVRQIQQFTRKVVTFYLHESPRDVTMLRTLMDSSPRMWGMVHLVGASTSCPIKTLCLLWIDTQKRFIGVVPLDQERFVSVMEQVRKLHYKQGVPSPAPPIPLYPSSTATSVGSLAQQQSISPEENEVYMRKLTELQRYIPSLQKWITRLEQTYNDKNQLPKLKQLYKVLTDSNTRVPLATLVRYGEALDKILNSDRSSHNMSLHRKFVHLCEEKKKLEDKIEKEGDDTSLTERLERVKSDLHHCHMEMKKSDQLFNEALAAGKVSTKITNVLIQGEAGVGKTSIKCLLLDQPPPKAHHSTPLAEAPVQIRVPTPNVPRCVSELRVLFSDNKWKALNEREIEKLVTKVISKLAEKISNKDKSETNVGVNPVEKGASQTTEEESQQTYTEEQIADDSESIEADIDVNPVEMGESETIKEKTEEQISEPVIDKFQQVLINIHGEMVDQSLQTITDPSGSTHDPRTILGSNWIYFIDSGGQPHFHNLLPHFIHGISIAIFVHRLSRKLEEQSEVMYSEDGQPITPMYQSNLTTKDILKCLLRSIQSRTVNGQKPKLLFIGTFLDEIQKSGETLEERNEKLLGLFTSEFMDQLLFSVDLLNELIFPVNTSKPGFHEKTMATEIRNIIENCVPSRTIDIPIWWYVLEIMLKKLSSQLNRIVLSKKECLEIARLLSISDDALIESLKFFHHQHIFHYYPNILPEIMFTSPQLLLDKVTELVKEAYLVRNVASTKRPSRKFRDQGIITLELLEQFDQHYITNLFSPCDLLKIFMHHLLITPLTSEEFHCVPDFTSCLMEYFMPSLLDMLSLAEVETHRIFSPDIHPLLIRFPNGWPRAGVFCCLQVYLIQQLGWKLLRHKQGKPKLIAQNCVMLFPPNSACIVILIDSFSYLEIHVRAPLDLCSKKCPMIQEHILKGIEASCRTLCYSEDQPSLAFFCPCTDHSQPSSDCSSSSSVPEHHAAELLLDEGYLRCTNDESITFKINKRHTIWLDTCVPTSTTTSTSTVEQFLSLHGYTDTDVGRECSDEHLLQISYHLEKWEEVAMWLGLSSPDIEAIRNDAQGRMDLMRINTLKKWKSAVMIFTRTATYRVLIEALLKCKCSEVALRVCKLLKPSIS